MLQAPSSEHFQVFLVRNEVDEVEVSKSRLAELDEQERKIKAAKAAAQVAENVVKQQQGQIGSKE